MHDAKGMTWSSIESPRAIKTKFSGPAAQRPTSEQAISERLQPTTLPKPKFSSIPPPLQDYLSEVHHQDYSSSTVPERHVKQPAPKMGAEKSSIGNGCVIMGIEAKKELG